MNFFCPGTLCKVKNSFAFSYEVSTSEDEIKFNVQFGREKQGDMFLIIDDDSEKKMMTVLRFESFEQEPLVVSFYSEAIIKNCEII